MLSLTAIILSYYKIIKYFCSWTDDLSNAITAEQMCIKAANCTQVDQRNKARKTPFLAIPDNIWERRIAF